MGLLRQHKSDNFSPAPLKDVSVFARALLGHSVSRVHMVLMRIFEGRRPRFCGAIEDLEPGQGSEPRGVINRGVRQVPADTTPQSPLCPALGVQSSAHTTKEVAVEMRRIMRGRTPFKIDTLLYRG